MIFVTGDLHGGLHAEKLWRDAWVQGQSLTASDYVIVCGDFGIWNDSPKERELVRHLTEDSPWVTLFVDGNHENFDRLNAFPIEERWGGKVHRVNEKVYHLMRGQVFDIPWADGVTKRFFAFGGAQSHDISAGVFEQSEVLDNPMRFQFMRAVGSHFRINRVSWWAEELPSAAECEEARQNLTNCGWQVDFVITHCLPTFQQFYLGFRGADACSIFLEEVWNRLKYQYWFCGHYHADKVIPSRTRIVFGKVVDLADYCVPVGSVFDVGN